MFNGDLTTPCSIYGGDLSPKSAEGDTAVAAPLLADNILSICAWDSAYDTNRFIRSMTSAERGEKVAELNNSLRNLVNAGGWIGDRLLTGTGYRWTVL